RVMYLTRACQKGLRLSSSWHRGCSELGPGEYFMCDYSLMGVPNRLAQEGEELRVHRFPTGTLGLASPADLTPPAHPITVQSRGFWGTLRQFFNPPDTRAVCAVCI